MNYFKKIKYKKINKNINIKKIYMCVKHEIPSECIIRGVFRWSV